MNNLASIRLSLRTANSFCECETEEKLFLRILCFHVKLTGFWREKAEYIAQEQVSEEKKNKATKKNNKING